MGIRLEVNSMEIEVVKGETILTALNRNGLHVPTICSMKDLSPTGACRMCVVEVEGRENLVPACSFPIEEPLKIRTHSPRVLRARKTNVELLLSNHPDDCLYCERNGSCELQSLSEDLNIRERRIPGKKSLHVIDISSPAIIMDLAKCILCGRCVRICEEIMSTSALDFAHRGNNLRISTAMAKPLNFSNCTACGQCLIACPTGALVEHVQFPDLEPHIHDPGKTVVVQYTPAVAISVAEQLGYKPGTELSGIINTALRRYGFDYVFETSFGAEVMIMEQAKLYADRDTGTKEYPLITSSCPAWVQFVEQNYPELIPHLSPLKSPHQITGSLIRKWFSGLNKEEGNEIFSVVVSSCTAAKREARHVKIPGQDLPVVDLVITTRELARLIRLSGLDLDQLDPEAPDPPFQSNSTAGILTGVAGGEAESTVRTIYNQVTGRNLVPAKLRRFRIHKSYREMNIKAGKKEIRMGCVSGLSNVVALLEEIRSGKRQLDLLEVMACPDGCTNGGGQPLPVNEQIIRTRSKAIYDMDNTGALHTAHQDPTVQQLYNESLGEPGSKAARDLLFTT
ncbi:MAG: (2Fe-2S)-binding protein [Bacteroidales bacterium]|nr:(2Fe-2S)-binding protein [Bacteroidales bacterium]